MKIIPHFKKLCDIVKDEGIRAGLKYVGIETTRKNSLLMPGATSSLYSSMTFKPENMPMDYGVAEAIIDSNGELIKFVRRESNNDTTLVSERKLDGFWEIHRYTPVKKSDGNWEIKADLPDVYQFK